MYPGTKARRNKVDGIAVRVVEYSLTATESDTDLDDGATTYRLLTTILDPASAPAADLAGLYAQRWEIETAFDELKTHQRGPAVVLRSKLPDGVTQEVYGYLCVHYAIRALMLPPDTLADAHETVAEEILHELLPARTHRANPRVVKRKMSVFKVQHPHHRGAPRIQYQPIVHSR